MRFADTPGRMIVDTLALHACHHASDFLHLPAILLQVSSLTQQPFADETLVNQFPVPLIEARKAFRLG